MYYEFICFGPVILCLGIQLKEIIQNSDKTFWTKTFIAALFIINENWKQPKCPVKRGLLNKLQLIFTIEYYVIVKTKGIKKLKAWKHTFNIMLSGKVGSKMSIQNYLRDIKIQEQNNDANILPVVNCC